MKKTVAFCLLPVIMFALVIYTTTNVFAEDTTGDSTTVSPKTKIQEIRENAQEKRAELKTILEEKKLK